MTRAEQGWWVLERRLATFAAVVAVGHHVGVGLAPLGEVGATDTRWADWADLLVPYLVVAAAAAVLLRANTDGWGWGVFVLGAVVYTQGHGIHLAGNSVDNAVGGRVAHLWDEDVGHWIWYVGLTLIVVALLRAIPPLDASVRAWPFALAAGFTWFDNTVEGGVAYFGIAVSVLVGAYAVQRRVLPIALAYLSALVLLMTWGVWQHGFPQFSQLGWI